MMLDPVSTLLVRLVFDPAAPLDVGRLAVRDRRIYFQFDAGFPRARLPLSPFKLDGDGVIELPALPFDGLAGLFNDSLPDGWGRLLLDRALRARGLDPARLGPLDRLAQVGSGGMGALTYHPEITGDDGTGPVDLDRLAGRFAAILKDEPIDGDAGAVLAELSRLNGGSQGARPKAMLGVSEDRARVVRGPSNLAPWLIKFPNSQDGIEAGALEYVYSLMARAAGIEMPDTHLFPAAEGPGYFGVARFDRQDGRRRHVHTASGLLQSDHRLPALDYKDLLRLTEVLTRDRRDVEAMYRLAVFNVLAGNRDDHAKNFAFVMSETGDWRLAPAYDLTFAGGPNGWQSTTVMGEGVAPGKEALLALAKQAAIKPRQAGEIIENVRAALADFAGLARTHGVAARTIGDVSARLGGVR